MKSYENEARRNMWQCNPNIKDWIIWIILPHQDEPSAASGRTGATRGEVEARPRLIPPVHVAVACLRTSAVGQLDWRRTRLSYNGGSGTSCRWLSLALKHCHAPSVQAAPWIFDIWCMVKKNIERCFSHILEDDTHWPVLLGQILLCFVKNEKKGSQETCFFFGVPGRREPSYSLLVNSLMDFPGEWPKWHKMTK
jgi:hypothetical protein